MEKNSNSILISILCGVGVCFLCLGIVFLLPAKNNSNLKGRNMNLGDEINGSTTCTASKVGTVYGYEQDYTATSNCNDFGRTGTCYERGSSVSIINCGSDEEYDCYSWTKYNVTCTTSSPTSSTSPTSSPTATSTVTCPQNMGAQSSCISEARGKCSGDYTGCNTTDANGCYSYTCSNPSPTATVAPTYYCCVDGVPQINIGACTSASNAGATVTGYSNGQCATPSPTATVDDSYGCYANGNAQGIGSIRWMKASEASGLTKLDISQDTCTRIQNGELCFKDSNNNYYWGYNYSTYEHVKGVTSQAECGSSSSTGCYCNAAGTSCVSQNAASAAYPVESSAGKCVFGSLTGNKIISISGNETVIGTYYTKDGDGEPLKVSSWSENGSHMELGDGCTSNSSTCQIEYTNENPCSEKNVTVTASYGNNTKTLDVSVHHFNPWSGPYDYGPVDENKRILNHTRADERYLTDCDAYEDWTKNESTGKWTAKRYYRCCGSGGGESSNPTPTPTPTQKPVVTPTPTPSPKQTVTPTPSVYGCYKDSNNVYHWTTKPEPSWIIISTITKPGLCEAPKPGCYEDKNGNYDWGYHADDSNYIIYHGEITDEPYCNVDPTYACYQKGDDYVWSSSQPEGYTKTTLSYDKCENPACYLNRSTQKMVWGTYSKNTAYVKLFIDSTDDQGNTVEIPRPYEQCKNNGCYKEKGTNNYSWGDHSGDNKYELIESITNSESCTPVKPTGVTVSTIVYVFIAILMAFGIGFIYYSAVLRKNN